MSRIEELPDDFDETLNLNAGPSAPAPTLDELYQQHLATPRTDPISDRSFEEIVQDMSKTPFFMNSLADATEAGTSR